MITSFNNFPLRYKLILSFLFIIAINSISGFLSVNVMKQVGELVNITYDKALMSGNFSQAVKFDFSQYDSEIKSALLADNLAEFETHVSKSSRALKTLFEDLTVVEERTISQDSSRIIKEVRELVGEFEKIKLETLNSKKKLFSKKSMRGDAIDLGKAWDNNPTKKSLYRKITALYDGAAEAGYQFRLSSEEKNRKSLQRTVLIVVSSLIASLMLAIGISFLFISPLFKLNKVCQDVSEGDYKTRSQISTKDELGNLASSFNFMLNTIEEKDNNMSSLLSALPFGVFYFDSKGKISKEKSEATNIIFPEFSTYDDIVSFYDKNGSSSNQIQQIIEAVYNNRIPFGSAILFFPNKLELVDKNGGENKIVKLNYKPRYISKKKLERIIVIAEDVTEKEKAIAETKNLTERVERISAISANIPGFKDFQLTINELFLLITEQVKKSDANQSDEFKRNLHSLKGTLGVFFFSECLTLIDKIEELLLNEKFEISTIQKLIFEANSLFLEQSQDVIDLLALEQDSTIKHVNIVKLSLLEKVLISKNDPELIDGFLSIERFPCSLVFAKYKKHIKSITEKVSEKDIQLVIKDDECNEVSYGEIHQIDPLIIHLINNSIDHGIEEQEIRIGKNKKSHGTITLQCNRINNDFLEVSIEDDGRGISTSKLVERALERGLIDLDFVNNSTDQEKLELIFRAGFSTKYEISEVSGRGIGLDAVKTQIERIGGSIIIQTEENIGTKFILKLPLASAHQRGSHV